MYQMHILIEDSSFNTLVADIIDKHETKLRSLELLLNFTLLNEDYFLHLLYFCITNN